MVYVVNSRRPVYKTSYGDGLSNTIAGIFARMTPKEAPLVKQLSMKAIDVICDKGINVVGDIAGKAFSAAKDNITSLVRRRKKQPLPSTIVMPAKVSKSIKKNSIIDDCAAGDLVLRCAK